MGITCSPITGLYSSGNIGGDGGGGTHGDVDGIGGGGGINEGKGGLDGGGDGDGGVLVVVVTLRCLDTHGGIALLPLACVL